MNSSLSYAQLIQGCLEGGFWEPPNESCCYSFGQRDDFVVQSHANIGPTVYKDPSTMVTLHFVDTRSQEFMAVQNAAALKSPSPSITLPFIFRVQNYARSADFLDYVESQPLLNDKFEDQLCFGFHSMKNHNMDWASLLVNGVDPNACLEGLYGDGAYFAFNAGLCVTQYSKKFYSTVYEDHMDPSHEPTMDTYTAVGMFLLNTGMKYTVDGIKRVKNVPDGDGAFQNDSETQICIQDYRRICPSYLLIYRKTVNKRAPEEYLLTNSEDAMEWEYIDPTNQQMMKKH